MVGSACAGDSFEPIVPCSDDQTVVVSVSPGTKPRFTWQPACGMASLEVWPAAGPPAAWVLYSGPRAAANPLPSGIRHGEPPSVAVEPAPPAALSAGVTYRVTVLRWIGAAGGPGSLFPRGEATFSP